jgi:hypothetical protein
MCVDVISSDTCDKNREKYDDARLISKMNTVSFRLVHTILKSNNPTSSFCYIIL